MVNDISYGIEGCVLKKYVCGGGESMFLGQ